MLKIKCYTIMLYYNAVLYYTVFIIQFSLRLNLRTRTYDSIVKKDSGTMLIFYPSIWSYKILYYYCRICSDIESLNLQSHIVLYYILHNTFSSSTSCFNDKVFYIRTTHFGVFIQTITIKVCTKQ